MVEVVKALAWPVVVLIIAMVLRKPLVALIPTLSRFRYKGLEAEFGNKLKEIGASFEKEIVTIPKEAEAKAEEEQKRDHWTIDEIVESIAPISPRAAILLAWFEVERIIRQTVTSPDWFGMPEPRSFPGFVKVLQEKDVLSENVASLLYDLRSLRNQAAHESDFNLEPDKAIEYSRLARRMMLLVRWRAAGP